MIDIYRVTEEGLEQGVVVHAVTKAAEGWSDAYVHLLISQGNMQTMIVALLLRDMEAIFDSCECAEDITPFNDLLSASWVVIEELRKTHAIIPGIRVERLKKYEADIRSGKHEADIRAEREKLDEEDRQGSC